MVTYPFISILHITADLSLVIKVARVIEINNFNMASLDQHGIEIRVMLYISF